MSAEFWVAFEEEAKQREEVDAKGREFLAGRAVADLTDDELNQLLEISDNFFDPRNPEHRAMQENRRINEEWEDYLKTVNDRSHIDSTDMDNEFGLNMSIINREYYHQPQLAGPYKGDDFLLKLQSYTAFTHDHRKLAMHPSIAYAVAEPDELIDNDEKAASYGVMFLGSFAYDMTLDVTLDLTDYDWDASIFSLYFALKASKINFVKVSKFLEYQLAETFKGDFRKFKVFLKALMRQYRTIEVGLTAEREVISQDLADTINEWIEVFAPVEPIKSTVAISNWQPDTVSVVKPREIHIQPEYLPYIAAKLQPYFSDEDFKILPSLLEGQPTMAVLTFTKGGAMLSYFLRQMHDKGIINSDKKETEEWLVNHFKFVNRKEDYDVTPFKITVVHKYLTLQTTTTLKGKTTIDISDLVGFENKNNLK
jgi:hypothetical protein